MLILDDRIPMDGHDPDLIIRQLRAAVSELQCSYLLLELQRKNAAVPVERIVKEVPCAVGVTPHYAKGIDCAVLKSRSPTCGIREVYDGTFSGTLGPGSGVFAKALMDAGIKVIDAEEL